MKYCSKCKQVKPIEDFFIDRAKKDGRRYQCKKCDRRHQVQYTAINRDEILKQASEAGKTARQRNARLSVEYLKSHPCVDCGESDPVVLDYDHVAGVKKYDVSRLLVKGSPWEKVLEEIAKCEVRCANCHRRKTFGHLKKFADNLGLGLSAPIT